jgi:hypothetical protein
VAEKSAGKYALVLPGAFYRYQPEQVKSKHNDTAPGVLPLARHSSADETQLMKSKKKTLFFNVVFGAIIAAFFAAVESATFAAEKIELPNAGFENGLEIWRKRTATERAYQLHSPGHEGKNFARLEVSDDDTQADREAVYLNRLDLPTAEGYYRVRFWARSELSQGKGGALLVNFDAENKVLSAYNPGAVGVPDFGGNTPWREYSYVYHVPANTKMSALQLNGVGIRGHVDYDAISIEKLDATEGKKMLDEQKTKFVIAPFVDVPPRTPKFPLKTQRMIYSEKDVKIARENIEKHPEAKAVRDNIVAAADKWIEWSDEDLRKLLTSARVPRAFDLNVHGCPVHGAEVFNKGGAYPWKLDPKHPLKVTCPVGGETYPSNDYEAYANSGFDPALKKNWSGDYVDDGWGWVDPKNGERYWFVAYANQWNWYRTIDPAMLNLSRAYLLTGDKRYAHKAAVMLVRLAEVYPSMDYADQSRYGMMLKMQGGIYPGKVLYHTWESFFARDAAEAYDNIWDSIDGDAALQKLYGKTGAELRGFVEANFLEDAVDAYFANKIEGNFGMHQTALLYILLARQNMDTKKYSHLLVDEPGKDTSHTGLRYALYNMVWRDGAPLESPGYNMLWLENFAVLGELLKKGGTDLFADPKMKLVFDSPLDMTNIGLQTPALGDSAGVLGGLVGRDVEIYTKVNQAYKDPRYLQWISGATTKDNRGFTTFQTLFYPSLPPRSEAAGKRAVPPQPSRLLAGNGIGILNNPADTVSLAMTYGMHISHWHYDFLHFDIFANGQAMLPDLGYGDAMNAYVSGIYTWTLNTIAHNTVVVDEKRQQNNLPGTLHEFAVAPFARSMDASSPAYDNAQTYRRHLVQVDAGDNRSYVVDVFRVEGGTQHDYSLHGPPGKVETVNGTWSTPAKGTLAGENVKLEAIYDDDVLGAEDYKGVYYVYKGSGYQHLFNVQKLQSGSGALHYRHVRDNDAQIRIHPLTQNPSEVFLADAYDLPRARKHEVKYLITRRKSENGQPLASTFISVLEPFSGQPFIQSTKVLALNGGDGTAVEVVREGGTDIILSDPQNTRKVLAARGIETDANSAVVSFDAAGNLQRVFFSGGTFLKCGEQNFSAQPVRGKVSAVDAMQQTISVALDGGSTPDAATLAQRVAHFSNAQHTTQHPIQSATRDGNVLTLKTNDAILVGRARVKKADENKVSTDTELPFSPTYAGTTLLSHDFSNLSLVKTVNRGEIELASAPPKAIAVGQDIWFSNIGVGDEMEFPPLFYWDKK